MTHHYAIEATCLADPAPTGIARYTRNLLRELDHLPGGDDFELVQLYRSSRYRRRHQLEQGRRLSRQLWRGALWPLRRPYDVVHATAYRLPPWRRPAGVSTIHDIYAALGQNFDDADDRRREIRTYRDLAARSAQLIFVSRNTRDDFLRVIGYDESRSHVTHLGVGAEFYPRGQSEIEAVRRKYGLSGAYLFFVGLANPNKNLPRLLEAFAQSCERDDFQLAIAGKASADQRMRLQSTIDGLRLAGRVRLLGFVADADLPALYSGAAAYLFPSLYEGFGLPILEAMATNTPVLTSTTSSCPEVANGHAILCNPNSVADIAHGIDKAVRMNSTQREAARAYAVTKTWRRTAEETLKVYRLACADRA